MATLEIPLKGFVKFQYVLSPVTWDGDSVRFASSSDKSTHQNSVTEEVVHRCSSK